MANVKTVNTNQVLGGGQWLWQNCHIFCGVQVLGIEGGGVILFGGGPTQGTTTVINRKNGIKVKNADNKNTEQKEKEKRQKRRPKPTNLNSCMISKKLQVKYIEKRLPS